MPQVDLCPTLAEMLEKNRTVGRSGKVFDGLASNSTIGNLAFIRKTMRQRQPARTLEVGLAFGASTLTFCFEHQQLGRPGSNQHVAIDPYQQFPWIDESGV